MIDLLSRMLLKNQQSAGVPLDLIDMDMAVEADAEAEVVAAADQKKKKKKKVAKEGRSAAPRASTSGSKK